jgi:GDP-fucose transporter C1
MQVARSLILPFTVIFQWYFLKQGSSAKVLISCAIVCFGFLIGLFGDQGAFAEEISTGVSFTGIFFGVFSSMTTAYHAIVIK